MRVIGRGGIQISFEIRDSMQADCSLKQQNRAGIWVLLL